MRTATQLEEEIREVEGVQVILHVRAAGATFSSYKEYWSTGLADDRRMSALNRRIATVVPGVSWSVSRVSGSKSISPKERIGAIRGTLATGE